jgi:hypothetical protein
MLGRLVRQIGSLFGRGSLADKELEDIESAQVMLIDVVPPPIPKDARRQKAPKSVA